MRALLLFVGLLLALSAVGIDLTALSVLGGAIGVGIGFGLQKIAANYVSGFVILAERSLRIGDMVKVDNFEGRITDIRTRYTVIRALNGREAIVPNEMLITQRVENSSLADPQVLHRPPPCRWPTAPTCVPCSRKLAAAIAAVPRVLRRPRRPACSWPRSRADGMDLTSAVLDRRPRERAGQRALRGQPRGARRCSNAEGVEIPFPQRVVHAPAGAPGAPLTAPSPQRSAAP